MASTDLKLDAPGTLTRPGPVGRVVGIGFGLICLWYVGGLIEVAASVTSATAISGKSSGMALSSACF
ncbi:MAG: hypothetical protein IID58_01770 [Proteobacteria bacterium]|nr:hypothetical protein [Pseudomonadota bacterium]